MKQIQFQAFGEPAKVGRCIDIQDVGEPMENEVVIEIEAFPINPADLLTMKGAYAVKPPLPATLGAEAVGKIAAIGSRCTDLDIGDRVVVMARDNWCQRRRVSAEAVIKMPSGVDPLQLAMLKVNPATALMMLKNYVDLQAGDWVIQNAANSGVGTNLIRLAHAAGLRTVNIVRRDELIEPLSTMGADVVLVDGDDLPERVRSASDNAPIKLAIDAVGGAQVMQLADSLKAGGTVVNYGLLSGKPCQIRADQTIFKSITLTGFWLQKALTSMAKKDVEGLYRNLAERVERGEINVAIEATYPIEDIQAALAHAGRSGRSGKILVLPNGPV